MDGEKFKYEFAASVFILSPPRFLAKGRIFMRKKSGFVAIGWRRKGTETEKMMCICST